MKVAIYTRVSTHHQIDKDSLPFQQEELKNYCKYVLNTENYEVFEDAGYSGKSLERPSVQEMITRLRSGEFTHLLVYKIDRISRNLLDFVGLYQELQKNNISFISKVESFDTGTAMGEAMLKITLVFAELERNMAAERVKSVMLSRASKGLWNGANVPLGYDWDDEHKTLKINPKEAEIVKDIFSSYLELGSGQVVANKLHVNNIKTKRGGDWSSRTILQILRNPIFKGTYRYNYRESARGKIKDESEWIIVDDAYPAIIDKLQWEQVQAQLKSNYKGTSSNRNSSKNKYALSGVLKCTSCGLNYTGYRGNARKDGYRPTRYSCSSYRRRNTCKPHDTHSRLLYAPLLLYMQQYSDLKESAYGTTYIKENLVPMIQKLIPDLIDVKIDIKYSEQIATQDFPERSTAPEDNKTKINNLEKEIAKYTRAIEKLDDLYLFDESDMSKSDYIIKKKTFTEKITSCEHEITTIIKVSQTSTSMTDFVDFVLQFLMEENISPEALLDKNTVKQLDENILQQFFYHSFEAVYAANKKINKIVMKDGTTHSFFYSA